MAQGLILTLSCPDRVGIVARLARLMEQHDCFIVASRTFGDIETGRFFARLVFNMNGNGDQLGAVRGGMQAVGFRRAGGGPIEGTMRDVGACLGEPAAVAGRAAGCRCGQRCRGG